MDAPVRFSSTRRGAAIAVRLLTLTLAAAPRADAQTAKDASRQNCVASLPADAFTRVPIYLEATPTNPSSKAILPDAATLMLMAAHVLRTTLGAEGDTLPHGEAFLHWRRLGDGLRVTVHRDGRFTWAPSTDYSSTDTLYIPSRNILEQALLALRDAGLKVDWPAGVAGESLTFALTYRWPRRNSAGRVDLIEGSHTVPVFSMAMPWEHPVVIVRQPPLVYPSFSVARSGGRIDMQFIVDSTGRVLPETIKEIWPPDRPRVRGENHQSFVSAAKQSLVWAQFQPATAGGCPVRQLVQYHFRFGPPAVPR